MPQITIRETGRSRARMVDESNKVLFSDNTLKLIAQIVSMNPTSTVTFSDSEAVIDIPE